MAHIVDVIRRVYVLDESACLEVGPSPDCPDAIELRTADQASQEWFGNLSLVMSPEFAKALASAIIASANELETKKP